VLLFVSAPYFTQQSLISFVLTFALTTVKIISTTHDLDVLKEE